MESAVAWVEITDAFNPDVLYTYQRGGTSSLWGDVKTVGSRAYVVGEGGGSIKTFDMSNIDNGVVTYEGESTSNGGTASHNIASVEQANLIVRCGGGSNGLRFYSTANNPDNPQFLGAWNDRYVHDACITIYPSFGPDTTYRGRIIGFLNDGNNGGGTNTGLSIVDFGTPNNINPSGTLLSRVTWSGVGYSHQSWHNDDFTWLISNDETALNNTADDQHHRSEQCRSASTRAFPATRQPQQLRQGRAPLRRELHDGTSGPRLFERQLHDRRGLLRHLPRERRGHVQWRLERLPVLRRQHDHPERLPTRSLRAEARPR